MHDGLRAQAQASVLDFLARRQRRHERGELRGQDRGDGLGGLVALGAVAHLRGEDADTAFTRDDRRHDRARERAVRGHGAKLALPVGSRCRVVGIAADAAHPREHVRRVAFAPARERAMRRRDPPPTRSAPRHRCTRAARSSSAGSSAGSPTRARSAQRRAVAARSTPCRVRMRRDAACRRRIGITDGGTAGLQPRRGAAAVTRVSPERRAAGG